MSKGMTRREFLRLAALGLAAAYLASRDTGGILWKETPDEIAERINAKYSVFIPARQAREFTYRIGTPDECPNANLSRGELREIESAMVEIPYAGHLAPILVIYRNAGGFWVNYDGSRELVTGGTYEGRSWPSVIGDLQTDYSDKPLLWLNIDKGLDFGAKTQHDRCRAGGTLKTNRENFKHLLYHEYGHGADREILFRTCKSAEEYKARRESDYRRDDYTIIDEENPIHATFAEVVEWPKAGGTTAKGISKYDPCKSDFRGSNIAEAFANWYASFLMYPQLLSSDARTYFSRIHKGLIHFPEEFMQEVARNPKSLLR